MMKPARSASPSRRPRASFQEIDGLYQKILRTKDMDDAPCVVVANKCDLESERQVTTEEGRQLADSVCNSPFFEASAKEKINNEQCFFSIVEEIRKRSASTPDKKKKKFKCTIL